MFKKLLSQIGIGAATVDTRLDSERCEPGGQIHGTVHIKGGNVDQEIDRIYLAFNTQYKEEVRDSTTFTTFTLDRFSLNEAAFTIEAGVEREIPFTLQVPFNTPLSISQSKSWIETGLDIAQAVDPSDRDAIIVQANDLQSVILEAMEELGFRLKKADTEKLPGRYRKDLPIAQELEYSARNTYFAHKLDEVELIMLQDRTGIDIVLQIDRRAHDLGSLFSEMAGADETMTKLSLSNHDLMDRNAVKQQLNDLIERYS